MIRLEDIFSALECPELANIDTAEVVVSILYQKLKQCLIALHRNSKTIEKLPSSIRRYIPTSMYKA